ncbi:hypothetical protein LEMLEM_LOCUS6635 [Lemmus lemmus]
MSSRLFHEAGTQRIVSLLGKFSSHFSVGTECPVKQSRQEQVFAQMTNQLHKEPL